LIFGAKKRTNKDQFSKRKEKKKKEKLQEERGGKKGGKGLRDSVGKNQTELN
jgi:hypothetical protein